MSRFLSRLDAEWNLAINELQRGEIRARQAGYLARTGEFDQARTAVAELRKRFGDGHSGRVTVWIMISEALILHYERLELAALDRVTRAQFLSRMMKDRQLEAIASAWRAHIEFDHSRFDAMFASLQTAIHCADADNNDALSRISNVACKTAILCGEPNVAKTHFLSGREYALKEGDQAGVEAIQHNRASFKLARLRSMQCFGDVNDIDIRETRVEIETARSLQNLTGVRALSSYIELCHARLLIIERRFEEAIDRLGAIKNVGPFPVASFHSEMLDLEIEYCRCLSGQNFGAIQANKQLELAGIELLDSDEKLVIRWMQLQLSMRDSQFDLIDKYKALFDCAVSEYHLMMEKLKRGLEVLSWRL